MASLMTSSRSSSRSSQLAHAITSHALAVLLMHADQQRPVAAGDVATTDEQDNKQVGGKERQGGVGIGGDSERGFDACDASCLDILASFVEATVAKLGGKCMKLARHAGRQQACVIDVVRENNQTFVRLSHWRLPVVLLFESCW